MKTQRFLFRLGMMSLISTYTPLQIIAGGITSGECFPSEESEEFEVVEEESTLVIQAVRHTNIDLLQDLLVHNSNVESTDEKGLTALCWAAFGGYLEGINVLMRHQANINHQDSQKKTPLLHAVEQKHLRAVRLLLTFGADKSLTDNRGNTAHSLALSKNFEAIASLIERFPYKPYKFVKKDEANMSENSCNICLEDLEPTSNFAIAKCGHYYHSSCLIQTALSGYSCPLCQEEFTGL